MCFLELQAPLSKSLERVWNCFTSGHAILWRYRLVVGYSSRCRPVDIKVTSFHDIFSYMSYWYQIKVKIQLILVYKFYFTYRNTMINFMVTLLKRFKLKWAVSFKYELRLYLPRFQNFEIQDFLSSPCLNWWLVLLLFNSIFWSKLTIKE